MIVFQKTVRRFWFVLPLSLIPILYVATLAQGLVLGDPTEYTFVANILGIAHPPGYAFITLVGKLFQSLIPFGPIPWRMHLLAATAATLTTLFIYATIVTLAQSETQSKSIGQFAALFAALTVGTAVNHWQHAIHTNPHTLTATFLMANLYFLTKWGVAVDKATKRAIPSRDKWLFIFCLSAGLGITHHPLTVMAFPAYTTFIIWKRPSILRDWRTLLKMVGIALLGLSVWVYYPIRSSMEPLFGPTTMNTLNGFLDHVLGRGLTESLPFFTLVEQPDRLRVFGTLLRLQYTLPTIFLAFVGLCLPLLKRFIQHRGSQLDTPTPSYLILYLLAFLGNYTFTISLRAQDIMAYLIGPFAIIGLLAGIGLYSLLTLRPHHPRQLAVWQPVSLVLAAFFLLGPVAQGVRNGPRVSLQRYDEGDAYVTAVFQTFAGQNQAAVLLNDWEHMTPLWYTQFVEKRWPEPNDVRPKLVSTAQPWLESVMATLPGGPVYLSNYRREVVDFGFRLRPLGPFYQVVDAGDTSLPSHLIPITHQGGDIELVGYGLPQTAVTAGDYVPLTLAMRTQGTTDYYVPVVQIGDISAPFTTDSHRLTPEWLPNEVIVERFDVALPHDLPSGDYPIAVYLKNLSTDTDYPPLAVGQLTVTAQVNPISTEHLLVNFRQRVGLVKAMARGNGRWATAPWSEPLTVQSGDIVNLTLRWQSLALAEESYTIFIHLIDANNQLYSGIDYTPLGGSAPTHLWIPKWLPGQQLNDPYRLQIPDSLPPGDYLIEVGLYEMVSTRRLHIVDDTGNIIGDRYILGGVTILP